MANTFSRVVFVCFSSFQNVSPWNYVILGVSETSYLIQLIEKFPAVMELEVLSLWLNAIWFTTYLVSFVCVCVLFFV